MNKLLFILIFGLFSCIESPNEEIDDPEISEYINETFGFKTSEFDIQDLKYNRLPYTGYELISLDSSPADSSGIRLYEKFGNLYYHPVIMAEHTIRFLDCYIRTENEEYLKNALVYSDKLIEIGTESNGAIYFPYNFELILHNIPSEVLSAPWYSGMAQGEALSAFVRLYNVTNEKKYLPIIEKIFKGFTNFKKENNPWFVYVDEQEFYWIEEYPLNEATHVLNGFIYAIFGLYDYYQLNKDELSRTLIEASLTTLVKYLTEYRDPGYKSFYCLKHKAQGEFYHQVHIIELKKLSEISGYSYFKDMADLFYYDFHL